MAGVTTVRFFGVVVAVCLAACRPGVVVIQDPVATNANAHILASQRLRLDNGMEVLLHIDRKLPLIAFDLNYGVGYAHDGEHRGLAHLVEHLMFAGTPNMPDREFGSKLDEAGAQGTNATTKEFRTSYHTVIPSEQLPLLLWLESDRMANTAKYLDKVRVAEEVKTIIDEDLDRVGSDRFGPAFLQLSRTLYPPGHPLRPATRETMGKLRLAHVLAFMARYYGPANATLVLAGDLPEDTAEQIDRLFGHRKGGERPDKIEVSPAPAKGERVITTHTGAGSTSLVTMGWPTPAYLDPDDAVADVFATLLDDAFARRIEDQRAPEGILSAQAWQSSAAGGSLFWITARAPGMIAPTRLRDFIDEVFDEVAATPVTHEVIDGARRRAVVSRLQAVQTLPGRAAAMQGYTTLGEPAELIDRDLARFKAVEPAHVQAFVSRYLGRERRVVMMNSAEAATP